MRFTDEQVAGQLVALLPPGRALPTEPGSLLGKLLEGIAGVMARANNRGVDLREEADPRSTVEMFTDWERAAGLPDSCTKTATTIPERRAALITRLTARGGQSIAYFLGIAGSLGYSGVTLEETRPFRCGVSRCGFNSLRGGAENRHRWLVTVPNARITRFRCGTGRCGVDPLAKIARAEDLECVLQRQKPAQSDLIVGYEGV